MALTKINLAGGVTGTLPTSNYVNGKVLQVVEGSVTSHTTITSASWVDVGLEVTITPSATSSKVLIIGTICNIKNNTSAGGNGRIRLQWDQIGGSYTTIQGYEGINGYNDNDVNNPSFTYLHSPSSTGATKYKIQVAQLSGFSSGSMRFNNDNADGNSIRSSIVAMEISA